MGRVSIASARLGRAASAVTCALLLSTIGCGGDHPATGDYQDVQSALDPNVTVSVGQSSYTAGTMVTIS